MRSLSTPPAPRLQRHHPELDLELHPTHAGSTRGRGQTYGCGLSEGYQDCNSLSGRMWHSTDLKPPA